MSTLFRNSVFLAALLVSGAAAAQTIVQDVGLDRSESIRYDAWFDRYIVANVTAGDAPGFISTINPDGSVDQLKWIEGGVNGVTLDNPRGTFPWNGVLYVADNQTLRMFDLFTGAPQGEVNIPDAITLNDLTVAGNGTVFITDSGSNDSPGAIFSVSPDQTVTRVAYGPQLNRPNGIAMNPTWGGGLQGSAIMYVELDGADLVTMAVGSGAPPSAHAVQNPDLLSGSSQVGQELRRVTLPSGRLDGLVVLDDQLAFVSSQDPGVIYAVDGQERARVVFEGVPGAAAIGYDTKRDAVLIPQTRDGRLTIVDAQARPWGLSMEIAPQTVSLN